MTDACTIELRVREASHLFDPLDASSLVERDLNRRVEEFIVESLKELHTKDACEVKLHLDQPKTVSDEEQIVTRAIRGYFARRAAIWQFKLQQLIRRGLISVAIGLAFLGLFFLTGRMLVHLMGENAFTTLVTESLIIGGWVAMWRPLEIFLYDWWPILGERRLCDRLSRLNVRIVYHEPKQV
jgi:hypothetical protein